MKNYYIYHIPGIKIGCTTNVPHRMQEQGFTEWEHLETHTDIYEVSDREIELQKEYGLPVDTVPYWQAVENRPKWNDKTRYKWTKEEMNAAAIKGNKHKRNLTFKQAQEIRAKFVPRKYTHDMLAKEYMVNLIVIRKILYNQTYITP